ncbi:MAG: RNA polymerase subunit sigma-70, partial [Ruminiclostridium sp.]|nr:RNA polymerase subunit sigma-70 [Ruminiclostridium sp.]
YYEGYSTKEIAEICRISRTLATTRLSRARKKLKNLLLKEGYYEK